MIKKALLLLSICLFTSCVVTKPRNINTIKTTSTAIESFYKQKNIPNYHQENWYLNYR